MTQRNRVDFQFEIKNKVQAALGLLFRGGAPCRDKNSELQEDNTIIIDDDYIFEEQQVYTSFVEKEEETKGMLNSIKNFGLSAWNI